MFRIGVPRMLSSIWKKKYILKQTNYSHRFHPFWLQKYKHGSGYLTYSGWIPASHLSSILRTKHFHFLFWGRGAFLLHPTFLNFSPRTFKCLPEVYRKILDFDWFSDRLISFSPNWGFSTAFKLRLASIYKTNWEISPQKCLWIWICSVCGDICGSF